MQFLCEVFTKLIKFFLSVWEKSYTTYIKRVLSCDFQITIKTRNIDGGGRECNFSLTILKENCLLFQLGQPKKNLFPVVLMTKKNPHEGGREFWIFF